MRIQPQCIVKNYYQTYPICVNQKEPTFAGLSYSTRKFSVQKMNPVNLYLSKLFQRSLIASRRRILEVIPELSPYTNEIGLSKNGKQITYAWDINKDNRQKYLVALHGMSQNISNLQTLYKNIIENTDYAIIAPEYRGFGKNKPSFLSKKTFLEDTTFAIDYLKNKKGIKPENIVVMGHSFGGFVASELAERNQDFKKLILVAPFDAIKGGSVNLEKGARGKAPKFIMFLFNHFKMLRKSLESLFQTNECLKNIKMPVNFVHSKNDALISYKSSQRLASLCQNPEDIVLLEKGGHTMDAEKINVITSLLNK